MTISFPSARSLLCSSAVAAQAIAVALLAGCGTALSRPDFANCIRNAADDCILFDDVSAILSDSTLSDEEKANQLRQLGIEDEKLIEALLNP